MIKIYNENQKICGSSVYKDVNECLQKMMNNKQIYYMKAVKHKCIMLPVTIIIDDFAGYRDGKCDDAIKTSLYDNTFKNVIETMLTVGCGALSSVMFFDRDSGLFDNESTNQTSQFVIGFVILIDKTVEKYMPIDALIYHEYYHCMKENGILSKNFYHILKYGKYHYTLEELLMSSSEETLSIGIDPQEEIDADQFARDNIMIGLRLYRIPKIYCEINNIHNMFKKLYVHINLYTYLILSRRKLFS